MVALEQISRSAELRICSEAFAPKMGLEQIRANICSNWSKYLLPVANPLICQNDMEEPHKFTILRLNFQNFLGVALQTPHLLPSKWYGKVPKLDHLKVKIPKFPGGWPPTSHLPPQNGMEEPPKCTIIRSKFRGGGPQTPHLPP